MTTTNYLLEANKISKEFNTVKVLSDVNFNLRAGEVHSLVGENGAGKSTFVKILTGVYQASSGSYKVKDKEVSFRSVKESEDSGILIIYQEINIVPFFNLYQNIFIGNELKGKMGLLDDKTMAKKAEEILAKLNLKMDVNKPVSYLNTTMQRIVQICSALIYKPDILIFDEPTTALGDEERERLLQIIRDLKNVGIGIIYISHDIDEIIKISDRVSVFKDGFKVGTLEKDEIDSRKIVSMMIGHKDYKIFERVPNLKQHKEMLRVEDLHTNKLKGINFSINSGEILGVTGVIGAGKTEIARTIFGLDRLKTGKIYLNGQQFIPQSTKSIKKGLALVPEERRIQGFVENFSVKQNITLAYLNKFVNNLFINERLEDEISNKRIKELSIKTTGTHQIIRYLSGGNQQKVVISKWLSGNFDVLILDEPTKGIDINAKRDIYELMHEITLEGKAVLFLSSYLPELLNYCDRIIVIKDGAMVGEFPATGPKAKEIITHAMLQGISE